MISVGGVDDMGTDDQHDDKLADWSSRGTTQDGFDKPEVVAPGAHITSLLAPNSAFKSLCPSCVVSNEYMTIGGTSMAAPMVAGAIALMLEEDPSLTPNEVKGAILETRPATSGPPVTSSRSTTRSTRATTRRRTRA